MGFTEFWTEWPKKCAKFDAEKAYKQQIKKGYTDAELLAGCRAFASLVRSRGTDRAFIPHAGTWLRAGRWLDDEISAFSTEIRPAAGVQNLDPIACGKSIVGRIGLHVFQAYFSGCQFTETSVIAPTEARKAMLINRFRHKLPDMVVEVKHD